MKQIRKLGRDQKGFTLVEMLVVITLIAVIGGVVVQNVMSQFTKAKVKATIAMMQQVGTVLDNFKIDCGRYPTTEEGLEALVNGEGVQCKNYDPEGYFKDNKIPVDGFDREFLYFSDGGDYELRSLGDDGKEGGEGYASDLSSKEDA